jgi:hypothetical protein
LGSGERGAWSAILAEVLVSAMFRCASTLGARSQSSRYGRL